MYNIHLYESLNKLKLWFDKMALAHGYDVHPTTNIATIILSYEIKLVISFFFACHLKREQAITQTSEQWNQPNW